MVPGQTWSLGDQRVYFTVADGVVGEVVSEIEDPRFHQSLLVDSTSATSSTTASVAEDSTVNSICMDSPSPVYTHATIVNAPPPATIKSQTAGASVVTHQKPSALSMAKQRSTLVKRKLMQTNTPGVYKCTRWCGIINLVYILDFVNSKSFITRLIHIRIPYNIA